MIKSPDDEDLMDVVERVLTADTADLRELALIAKADPRTLYIGTSLDGVDLRGQDLRGMLLTNLDRAKVRTDAATRLDLPEWDLDDDPEGDAQPLPDALVFIPIQRLWGLVERSGLPTSDAAYFGPGDAAQFVAACRTFPGAKLVLIERDRDRGWPWEDAPLPKDVVVLVYDRKLTHLSPREKLGAGSFRDAPRVLIPTLREERPAALAGVARFPTALRDAIIYFSADWDTLYHFARKMRRTAFLRAAGTPTSPDAWIQMYSWAVTLGVQAAEGWRMGLPRGRSRLREPEYEEFLFERLRWQEVDLPPKTKFFAAALFAMDERELMREELSYAQGVLNILSAQHWAVKRISRNSPTRVPRLQVQAGKEVIELSVAANPKSVNKGVFTPKELSQVNLQDLPIVVTEMADTATVVARAVQNEELRASVRDLVNLEARDGFVWRLIANISKRMAKTGDFVQRTQFLTILAFHALRSERGSAPPLPLPAMLNDPDFIQSKKLRLVNMEVLRSGHLSFQIVVSETYRHGNNTSHLERDILHFGMLIDETGPMFL